ncbi:ribonuclease P protein subunit p20-like [Histomonas meleagridis]|uniref:ribonuclease P protein subunit p20-like n=1 Tax=Histomonas meleagridis TaxID=135588 RepID=UPI00355A2877|nr:ribonuclease P protein subunit p20-like [Histomonas meleagridis]KAH0803357.1 ribonuclease P protein subunit p20-like [Histomonas meleagridis]
MSEISLQAPSSIRIRGQVTHEAKKETDVYFTKDISLNSIIPIIEKKIHKFGFVNLHSLGAANYKALKVGVMIQKAHPEIKADVTTSTVETTDFIIPITPGQERQSNNRSMNAVSIYLHK